MPNCTQIGQEVLKTGTHICARKQSRTVTETTVAKIELILPYFSITSIEVY